MWNYLQIIYWLQIFVFELINIAGGGKNNEENKDNNNCITDEDIFICNLEINSNKISGHSPYHIDSLQFLTNSSDKIDNKKYYATKN